MQTRAISNSVCEYFIICTYNLSNPHANQLWAGYEQQKNSFGCI